MMRFYVAALVVGALSVSAARAQTRVPLSRFLNSPGMSCHVEDTTPPPTQHCWTDFLGDRHCEWVNAPGTSATFCSWGGAILPAGDLIQLSTECCAPEGTFEIVLQVSDKVSGWKELGIDNLVDQRISLNARGYSIPSTPEMRVGPLSWNVNNVAGKSLVFSRAQYPFGNHTAVYTLDLAALAKYAERIVVFHWNYESGSGPPVHPDPQYLNPTGAPYDGTLLQDDAGAIWVIAGGARFHVPDPATLARLFPGARLFFARGQVLGTLPNLSPADQTLLREENGSIWVVAGGAKFHVPDNPTLDRLYPGRTAFQLWDGAPDQIPNVPVDDTLIREDNGAIWFVAGQARFHVPDMATYNRLFGGRELFQLWDGAPDRIPTVPVDDTLFREESGAIWIIVGQAKFHVPDPTTLNRLFPDHGYFQLWDGATDQIPNIPVDGTALCEEPCQQKFVIKNGHLMLADPALWPVHQLWKGALAQIPKAKSHRHRHR
jgi:hypothetical protein